MVYSGVVKVVSFFEEQNLNFATSFLVINCRCETFNRRLPRVFSIYCSTGGGGGGLNPDKTS